MLDQSSELVEKFQNFFHQHLASLLTGLVVLSIFILLGVFLKRFTKNKLLPETEDRLLVNFISRVILLVFLLIGVAIFLNIMGWGGAASGLLAGAGVSAIIIGFAFKDIGENFLAGFFLAFSRPFGIGDVIEIDSLLGEVKSLNFRNTHIRTYDGKDIFLPNAMLIKQPLVNYTRDGLLRYDFLVGVDYSDNLKEVTSLIKKSLMAIDGILKTDLHSPSLLIEEFGTSTVNIRVYYWINTDHFKNEVLSIRNNVMNKVLSSLIEGEVSLPADIIELKIYQEGKPIPLKMLRESLANQS